MSSGIVGALPEYVTTLGSVVTFALLARWSLALRSWSRETILFRALVLFTEPWITPLRRFLPRLIGIDLSPLVGAALTTTATIFLRLLLTRGNS
jgi:uncharacterized protein YggT (Ycf19 family)